jgi:hypothetical protein
LILFFWIKEKPLSQHEVIGYHSEWNLGSPGGWDYQRITQDIGKAVWDNLSSKYDLGVTLNFGHPLFYPVHSFVDMLLKAHRLREGSNPGLIAVVAEEETLADVIENINLAEHLQAIDGISGALMAPHELDLENGRVCWRGQPVSVIFMDFNTDILLKLHRKHNLSPVLKAVAENRVINPRGTEPINAKSVFEVLTDPQTNSRFHKETILRTPWTRQFCERRTKGRNGEEITDLITWTHKNWENLVLKPERGYSGKGVRVGGVDKDAGEAINLALQSGDYIVQEKIPLPLWAEDIPEFDEDTGVVKAVQYQTDFRCLFEDHHMFGFVCRYGSVPTNVGSGGGFQPMAVLTSDISVREATFRVNEAIQKMDTTDVLEAAELQKKMAMSEHFTYLLGPVKMALRPRIITSAQIEYLKQYCDGIWSDCLTLETMWLKGELDNIINIESEELDIARSQPWGGSPAILASDGIFSFGAHKQ